MECDGVKVGRRFTLLDEVGEQILLRAPSPEQARDGHVDDDQGRGEECEFATEQAEAGIDVAGEDVGETDR
jgi:hypothetical protein